MNLENVIAFRPNKTVYRDGDAVIKVFGEDFATADILNEALNQARVQETGLNIPKIREVTKVDGKWAIVSDYIEGVTLESLMAENPDRFDEYLEFFVDVQLGIQAKKCPLLGRLRDKMERKILQTNLDITTKYDLHTRLESMPKHDKLCHGDFNPSNIIIKDDGTPYIIDWAHATQGNASADAARTYLLFWLAGDSEKGERYLELFCKKSNTARKYVQKWLPIVAASQSVKGNVEERDLLLSWVSVVDYQ